MNKSQKGSTLIEVVIGIALLSIVLVAVVMGIVTAFKTDALANKQSTTMILVQNQIESLQLQIYQVAADSSEVTYAKVSELSNYTIWSYNRAGVLVSNVIGVPWANSAAEVGESTTPGSASDIDNGLQKIDLVIKQGNSIALNMEIYKVK